ncbi:MAG: HD domain-containing phosphohydrolase [Planctomycetota bacterium]
MANKDKPQPKGRILLVDDEQELRFILGAHLNADGFEVIESGNGCEAVHLAKQQLPDVIIMDFTLPSMDGMTATKAIKADARTAHIPVIMLTARSNTTDIVRCLEAGAQEYLVKPFDITEVLARVRTVFRLAVAHRDLDSLNSRLEAEVRAKTKHLETLYEFMRDLHQADTMDKILDLVINGVVRVTGAERVSLFLKDQLGQSLVCRRAVGIDPAIAASIRLEASDGITGQVFRSRTTLAAKAYSRDSKGNGAYHQQAFLSTPIVTTSLETPDGTIGVLNVTNKPDDAPFSDEEIECVRSMTDAAAIAFDNAIRRERLSQSVRVLLQTVGQLAEYRDEETNQHLARVSLMSRILALELQRNSDYAPQITDEFIDHLVQAAPMHDIGKVGIPDDILTKPGKLTDEEFQIMKTHTDIGRRVLSRAVDPTSPNPLLQMCIDIAYSHHERFDGKGYPRRIAGLAIPLSARIIALVDAYDAITSHRRYKKASSHETACGIIETDAGKHFDPIIVETFLRCRDQFDEIRAVSDPVINSLATVN